MQSSLSPSSLPPRASNVFPLAGHGIGCSKSRGREILKSLFFLLSFPYFFFQKLSQSLERNSHGGNISKFSLDAVQKRGEVAAHANLRPVEIDAVDANLAFSRLISRLPGGKRTLNFFHKLTFRLRFEIKDFYSSFSFFLLRTSV